MTARTPALLPAQLHADADALLEALAQLYDLLKQLDELTQAKVAALRRADAAALEAGAVAEARVLAELLPVERARQASLARLAQSLRWPEINTARLAEIAEKLPPPISAKIQAKTVGLREIATRLGQKNQLAADVARQLQRHVRNVFTELAKANQEVVVYGRDGKHEPTPTRTWVDAVG